MSRPHATLILPDLHVPWQNRPLLARICKLGQHVKIDHLILSGDFADLYSLSRHHKHSLYHLKDLDLSAEYKACKAQMAELEQAFRRADRRDYIYGNHEANYSRWIEDGDNAKVGNELGRPEEAMRLRERGWRVHTDWKEDSVKVGKHLEVIHGLHCNTHPAYTHLRDAEGSVVFGHTHRWNSYVTGKRASYNIGFLGDVNAAGFRYESRLIRNRWQNGFAVAYTLDCGNFLMAPVQCYQSRFVFNGRLY